MATRSSRSKAADNPYLTSSSPDDLGPANRLAYDLVAERRDLLPSVERIMNAGLDDDATVEAMTLFRDAIGAADDPYRDPRKVIAKVAPAGYVPPT